MTNAVTVRDAIAASAVRWSAHAARRMVERDVTEGDVLDVLAALDVIEDYEHDFPFPSALFVGESRGRPLHVVAALDPDGPCVHIITVYEPDPGNFGPDLRTRARQT